MSRLSTSERDGARRRVDLWTRGVAFASVVLVGEFGVLAQQETATAKQDAAWTARAAALAAGVAGDAGTAGSTPVAAAGATPALGDPSADVLHFVAPDGSAGATAPATAGVPGASPSAGGRTQTVPEQAPPAQVSTAPTVQAVPPVQSSPVQVSTASTVQAAQVQPLQAQSTVPVTRAVTTTAAPVAAPVQTATAAPAAPAAPAPAETSTAPAPVPTTAPVPVRSSGS